MNDLALTARIDRLHRPGLVDMHFDLLTDLYEKRQRQGVLPGDHWPEFHSGGIGVVGANIFLMDNYLPEQALRVALDQVARLYAEVEQTDNFAICRTYADIEQARQSNRVALLIAMEGVEPLGQDLNLLRIFYELGLRELSLTHSRRNWAGSGGIYAASGSSPAGLTAFGREVVRLCQQWGLIIDLAHINPAGFDEVIALTTGPLIVSHTNPRHFFDMERNISDDQIRQIGERGGVIGLGSVFLSPDRAEITLDNFVNQLEYVANLIGIEGVGLGFDFFESILEAMPIYVKRALREQIPDSPLISELQRHGQARNVTQKLIERGFGDDEIAKILYGNFMRIFEVLL
jgi:membrane dipeptidase